MRTSYLCGALVLFAVGCNSSNAGTTSSATTDAGTGGASGTGASFGTGGTSGAAASGASTSGTGGASAGTGGVETGGAPSCFGANGALLGAARACTKASDCGTLRVATCCGADSVTGVAVAKACVAPGTSCGELGCVKWSYLLTDDGTTTESGGTVEVTCAAGTCKTFVASTDGGAKAPDAAGLPDAGFVPCGTGTCSPSQECVIPCCGGSPGFQCTPSPPYCVDVPAACHGTPSAQCFQLGSCASPYISGRDLRCTCQ